MKVIKTASNKHVVKISKLEWASIGAKQGWFPAAEMAALLHEEVARIASNVNNIDKKIVKMSQRIELTDESVMPNKAEYLAKIEQSLLDLKEAQREEAAVLQKLTKSNFSQVHDQKIIDSLNNRVKELSNHITQLVTRITSMNAIVARM